MKTISILVCIFFITGCSREIKVSDLKYLNGYWEIKEVTFKDGTKKEYNVNPIVDYIKLEDLTGYRKKVQPQFDGTFATSDDAERFVIAEGKDSFILNYKTELSSWSEELTTLSQDRFSVQNEDGITYSYKRFEPINMENNGKAKK